MRADIVRALSGRPVHATPVLIDEQTQVIAAPPADAAISVRPARREHYVLKSFVYLLLFGLVGAMVFGGVYELRKSFSTDASPKVINVPNVLGLKQADADAAVKAKGLIPVDKPDHNNKPAGIVFDQSPVALAEARPNSQVTINVSLGAAPVPVPPLAGSTIDGAITTLRAQGFTQGPTTVKDGTTPKGQVISSTPAQGVMAPYGSAVSLTVGSGMVTVPYIVGKQLADATQILIAAGLGAPLSTYKYGPQPVNDVRYQLPWKGKVPLGYQVTLTVSLGKAVVLTTTPPPTTPPASITPTTVPPPGTTTTTPPPPGTTTTPVTPTTTPPAVPTTSAPAAPKP